MGGEMFVANDTYLDNGKNRIFDHYRSRNMAGKSTYMRQTALITLMAQIGSFVRRMRRISVSATVFLPVWALRMI